jgi:hypothetical protein
MDILGVNVIFGAFEKFLQKEAIFLKTSLVALSLLAELWVVRSNPARV